MKKIYFILSLAVVALLSSCSEDYNEHNFPGYKDAATPTNLATYTYTMTSADYTAIGATYTKVYTDSVASLKSKLKEAKKNNQDTTVIFANITRISTKLATDSTLVAADAINKNQIFINNKQASKCLQSFLNTKYLYADENSSATVNYNLSVDTTTIVKANKYTLVDADYTSMGTAPSAPGQYKNFSSTTDPNYYIPLFLKRVFNGVKGDLKLIRYKYYNGKTTSQVVAVYVYDGTNWANSNTAGQTAKSFAFRGGKWLDLLIYKGLISGLTDFTAVNVSGAQVWSWDATYGAKISGYDSSAKVNATNEDWLISPTIDLTSESIASLTFNHTGKYFATVSGVSTLKNDATLLVSTDYSGNQATANWTPLTIPAYWTADFVFVPSGKIDLKAYAGKKINIALKYMSSPDAAGTWELSNFVITKE